MDVFIYLTSGLEIGRDEIEDALQDRLGDRGEITGSGAGTTGSNIDVEIYKDEAAALRELLEVLRGLDLPRETVLVVDGERRLLG